ncbi:ParA family protein [Psychrobacter pacificensis]|uniref:ParA family protein n=1 Tax=Psychrobacter pacificensis TaxID=112002 RepID=UPI0028C3A214|nr:ParA family protein [Psychrobacter pacificensis]
MPKVIAVINQKGGVGKTTTAHAIGAWLQLKKKQKVLFIDLDQQGNLTYATNSSHSNYSSLQLLITGELEAGKIQQTKDGFSVIPSDPKLANIDMILNATGKEYKLKEALQDLQGYDYVVMDTPPSVNVIMVNALTASHFAIIPAQADIFSLQGITQLGQSLEAIKRYTNKELEVLGIVLTRHNPRTILSRDLHEVIEQTANQLDTKVYSQVIRESVSVKEAQATRKDLFTYDDKSNASQDYNNLMQAIWKEIK